jgi:23S rRNA pseudouridine1911/1915/1917 synthase
MPSPSLVIMFEDPDMLVVVKPAGVHTAPLRRGETGTLLEMVTEAFPEVAALPGVKQVEPGLLHRLDQETSGLVVVARTAKAFTALRRAFASGSVLKEYLAGCAYRNAEPAGTSMRIESRFAPYGAGRRMVRVVPLSAGERGIARQVTRETYATEAELLYCAEGRALISARITKGFRHQIRAHLSFLGYPILGDALYGAPVPAGVPPRMYLHAARLEMPHPMTGAPLVVTSPVPVEFGTAFPHRPRPYGKEL